SMVLFVTPIPQPLLPTRVAPILFLEVAWEEGRVKVMVNGGQLKSIQEDTSVYPVLVNDQLSATPLAPADQNARTACQTWMGWRRTHLATPRTPDPNRRLKPYEEQVIELEGEVEALKDLAEQVRSGKHYLRGRLFGSLRSLVYWQMRKN